MDRLLNISKVVNNTDAWAKLQISATEKYLPVGWNASTTLVPSASTNNNNNNNSNHNWVAKLVMSTMISTVLNSTSVTNSTNPMDQSTGTTSSLISPSPVILCFNNNTHHNFNNNHTGLNATYTTVNGTGIAPDFNFDFNVSTSNFNCSNDYNYFHDDDNDNNEDDENDEEFAGIISDAALDIIVFFDYVIVSGIICVLGIVFNIINAVIFHRLGFGDTINIMLFSLAITDLGALVPLLWKAVLFNPLFHDWDDLPFDYMTFQYYTGGWPHACFANISCLIIAFVTLDRCLCIAKPLKVRSIITPRRTVIVIAIFFIVLTCSLIPLFCTVHFGPIFFENQNKSLISLVHSDDATYVENITLTFYTFNQLIALVAVILFTTILVVQLKRKSAWRLKTSSAKSQNSNSTGRDTKIVKMVLFISIVYIVCYVPGAINIVVMIFVPDYSLTGRYKNVCTMVWAKLNIFEAFNSTINIFIYTKMSSKFSQALNKMFGRVKAGEAGSRTNGSANSRSNISGRERNGTRNKNSSVSKTNNTNGSSEPRGISANASIVNETKSNNGQHY